VIVSTERSVSYYILSHANVHNRRDILSQRRLPLCLPPPPPQKKLNTVFFLEIGMDFFSAIGQAAIAGARTAQSEYARHMTPHSPPDPSVHQPEPEKEGLTRASRASLKNHHHPPGGNAKKEYDGAAQPTATEENEAVESGRPLAEVGGGGSGSAAPATVAYLQANVLAPRRPRHQHSV
jgi:hypothetical protein